MNRIISCIENIVYRIKLNTNVINTINKLLVFSDRYLSKSKSIFCLNGFLDRTHTDGHFTARRYVNLV